MDTMRIIYVIGALNMDCINLKKLRNNMNSKILIEMPLYYEQVNIRGTLNMMEEARQKVVKKFFYASSSSVYDDHPFLPKKRGRRVICSRLIR